MTQGPLRYALGCLVLAGCPNERPIDPRPGAATDATAAAEPDAGFRARAHKAALDRFVAAGQHALALADPISASALGASALGPSPLSRSARAPIRKATSAALQELDGIDRQALSAEDGMQRDLIATALHAVARELDQRPIIRRDPTAFTRHGDRMLTTVEQRLATNSCEDCGPALRALGSEFSRGLGQLGASSRASLAAAQTDLQALDVRLAGLQGPAVDGAAVDRGAVDEAREGLARLSTRLQQIEEGLAKAATVSWSTPISGATAAGDVRRLPDRLGAPELTRRLGDEEAWSKKPEALAAEITKLLARLTAMRARLSAPTDTTTASPVTIARCRELWAPLSAWAERNPAIETSSLDCAVPWPQQRPDATDAALTLDLFQRGVVTPSRDTRRKAVPIAMALSSGVMAAEGQRLALSVSGLIAAQQPAAADLAISHARAALCVALAAVLEHAEIGELPSRTAWLSQDCSEHDPAELVTAALARPREALAAAGMTFINPGPANAAALSRFWWAPLGLVGPLADPPKPASSAAARGPKTNIEILEPAPR